MTRKYAATHFTKLLEHVVISLMKFNLPVSVSSQETQPKIIDVRSGSRKLMIGYCVMAGLLVARQVIGTYH